jgi:hypothetical protein
MKEKGGIERDTDRVQNRELALCKLKDQINDVYTFFLLVRS